MIGYFSYLLLNKIILFPFFLQFLLYDDQLRTLFGVFITAREERLYTTDVTFSVSCELSQSMGKTEFSSTAKNRINSVS